MTVSEIQVRTRPAEAGDDRTEALAWLRRQLDWETRLAQLRAGAAAAKR